MDIKKYDLQGNEVGIITLDESVFGVEVSKGAIFEAIKNENANRRLGNHQVKNRIHVRGGGAKPWRQKGTGRARHGSNRSPIWRGGGTVFGPTTERNYKYKLPQKAKQAAVRSILSLKAANGDLAVITGLKLEDYSTRSIAGLLKNSGWKDRKSVSMVLANDDEKVKKSIRNIANVQSENASRLSCRGLYYNHGLMIAEEALEGLVKQYKGK